MAILSLTDGASRLCVDNGVLTVDRAGERHALVLDTLDEVHLHGHADLSPAARLLLLRRGVDVAWFTRDGRYLGRLQPARSRAAARRFAWYRYLDDPARRLALARALIRGKIDNQRRLLVERQRRARHPDVADRLAALRALRDARLPAAADASAILGCEGAAAALHFAAMGALNSHPDLPFTARSRRPPKDGFNAALSYGYALLQSKVEHALWRAGLDPGLGALHSAERGAPALALDLMEELRPVIDDLVLTLVNRRQLHPDDFRRALTDPEAGLDADVHPDAVLLGKVGRSVLLHAWSRALARDHPHPRQDRRMPLALLIDEQALQLAALAEGRADAWVSVALTF